MSKELSNRPNAPLHVLLAEDDAFLAEFLRLQLIGLGCRVRTVGDGAEALEALAGERFHVLITDWMMPRMDGFELTRALRARPPGEANLHIIMMTARRERETMQRALQAGVDDVLYKPIDGLELELCVASAHRVVQLHRRLQRRNRHVEAAQQRAREAYDRVAEDLRAAGAMQLRLLPAEKDDGPIRYAWAFAPSLHIGGDGLGAIVLSDTRMLFFHFDVAGHGVPAALRSFATHRRLMQLAPAEPPDLAEATEILHREIQEEDDSAYLTLGLGLLDVGLGRLFLLRAGHPPPLLIPAEGPATFLEDGGLPVGLLPSIDPQVVELAMKAGDKLLLYSDGIMDPEYGGCFEWEELREICTAAGPESARDLARRLEGEVRRRLGAGPPADDISILAIEFAAPEEDDVAEALLETPVEPTLDGVRDAAGALRRTGARHAIAEEAMIDLELAWVEAGNNIVLHGAREGSATEISIRLVRRGDILDLEVVDTGLPIPEAARSAQADERPDEQAEHGRGLAIIEACADELFYVAAPDHNRLVIRKRIAVA